MKTQLIIYWINPLLLECGEVLFFLLFFNPLFLECGEVHASSFRIVGGEDTQFGGHPWMVTILLAAIIKYDLFTGCNYKREPSVKENFMRRSSHLRTLGHHCCSLCLQVLI